MFRIEHPELVYLYMLLPLMVLAYLGYRWWRNKQWSRFASESASGRILDQVSSGNAWLRFGLVLAGFLFMATAFINPQWGFRKEKVKAASADLYIAIDISNSMLAEDVAPSRLDRAKHLASRIAGSFRAERIGLILFAGNAYLQTPLTTDFAAVQMFIRAAHTGQAATQGTSFAELIDLVMKAHREDENSGVALIILTDGENQEPGALEAMAKGKERGIVPVLVAVGTEAGGQIPLVRNGRQDVKRDKQGTPVVTQLNTEFLKELASAGGGEIFTYQQDEELIPGIRGAIDKLGKQEIEARSFTDYRSFYPYFLGLALLCFLLEHVIGEKRTRETFIADQRIS